MECDGEFYVQFLANEVPVALDVPGVEGTKWKWGVWVTYRLFKAKDFIEQWIEVLKNNNMENCLYEDWKDLCGTPECTM